LPKPARKFSLFIYAALAFFLAFLGKDFFIHPEISLRASQPSNSVPQNDDFASYIDEIRGAVGLLGITYNDTLARAAQSHADYILRNQNFKNPHDEVASGVGFTGEQVFERAVHFGYFTRFTAENISQNELTVQGSVDNLLSSIYHRFGFLNYALDEIGMGRAQDANRRIYVYNMGNGRLNVHCMSVPEVTERGYYLSNICADTSARVAKSAFDRATQGSRPQFIRFPLDGYGVAYFGGEDPDPMPGCKITGNPVSIEFAHDAGDIKMRDFEIFAADGTKITDTRTITQSSDVNHIFTDRQFALFPRAVLDFGADYRAKFSFTQDGKERELEWKFRTKTPYNPYFVVRGGEVLGVEAGKTYDIFFAPNDCNDVFEQYSVGYTIFAKPAVWYSSHNTLTIKVEGVANKGISITTDNGKRVDVVLLDTSDDFKYKNLYLIIFAIVALVVVLTIINERRRRA